METLISVLDENGRCPEFVCTSSGSLTISRLTGIDKGAYTCRASIGVVGIGAIEPIIPNPFILNVELSKLLCDKGS